MICANLRLLFKGFLEGNLDSIQNIYKSIFLFVEKLKEFVDFFLINDR